MNSEKLKVVYCPFCGKEGVSNFKKRGYMYSVVCSCGAMGPMDYTREKAIVMWNKRSDKKLEEE